VPFGAGVCAYRKLTAEAAEVQARLVAHARDLLNPNPDRLVQSLSDADARCLADFAEADGEDGCIPGVDPMLECERPNAWDGDLWAQLWPTCGDSVLAGGEACDGQNDDACPGRCSSECACVPPGAGACGDDLLDAGEQCDGIQPGECGAQPFANQCGAAGSALECQCCSTTVCLFDGIPSVCCPGLTCVPTGGVHTQSVCQ
jgi:hypothetical protein